MMKKYDKYKDSGVEWIGEIPVDWGVKRGDSFLNLKKNLIKKDDLNGREIYHYSIPSIQDFGKAIIEDGSTVDSDKYEVTGNEILFSKLNPRKGTVVLSLVHEKLAIASTEFVVLEPIAGSLTFFFYYVTSDGFKSNISSMVESATKSHQRANPTDIYKSMFVFPSLTEQTAIANYLDRKTAEIDELIADKKRLLELYEEEKTSIINQAVTKGINPDVKMKDSGIEWLGEIPEHWEVKRLKHLSSLISKGTTPSTVGRDVTPSGDVRFIKAENIVHNQVSSEPENFIDFDTNKILSRSELVVGDILFVIAGATLGKIAILKLYLLPANTNQAISFIRLKDKSSVVFLWYYLQSITITRIIWLNAVQSAQPNLSMENLGNFYTPLPSQEEQNIIVRHIETECTRIDIKKSRTKKLIDLLTEYRTALISEVVTGKIMVVD